MKKAHLGHIQQSVLKTEVSFKRGSTVQHTCICDSNSLELQSVNM